MVSLDGAQAYPVRQFYIPAFGSFTLNNVTAGSYDIRYRDLDNGGLSRSEAFNLEENPTYDGTQFSNITITLYKVRNGNMKTYGLAEAEFRAMQCASGDCQKLRFCHPLSLTSDTLRSS